MTTVQGDLFGQWSQTKKKGKGALDSDPAGISWAMRQGFDKTKTLTGHIPWTSITRFEMTRMPPRVATVAISHTTGSLTLVTRKWHPPAYRDGWQVSKPSLYSIAYHAEMYLPAEARAIEPSGVFGPVTQITYEQARFDREMARLQSLPRSPSAHRSTMGPYAGSRVDRFMFWSANGHKRYPGPATDADDRFFDWIAAGCPGTWTREQHRAFLVKWIQDMGDWMWPPKESPELAAATADEINAWINARAKLEDRWRAADEERNP